jgi:hypothetical protein
VWDDARRELDCWADTGLTAKFWVRDDDASEKTQNLERLRDLAFKHNIKIGLAVIPGKIAPNLSDFLDNNTRYFYPMCHGWQHINHNQRNKPAEFGPDRPISSMIMDAQSAFSLFNRRLGTLKVIFVPPFNRVTPALIKALPNIGFFGTSLMPNYLERKILQLGSRLNLSAAIKIPDFSDGPRIDVHLDLINWREKTAQETKIIVSNLVQQLRGRRLGLVAADKPIGLLTHHLAHNERIWRACHEVLEVLQSHKAVEFIDVAKWADEYSLKLAAPRNMRTG